MELAAPEGTSRGNITQKPLFDKEVSSPDDSIFNFPSRTAVVGPRLAFSWANMKTNQLEIALPQPQNCTRRHARQLRQNRARWWFAQMRRVVDEAAAWAPAPAARPLQAKLPLAGAN